jgi:hypothetical protein
MNPTTDRLAEILGADFWTAQVESLESAHRQAAQRMAAGRPAVSWQDEDGHAFVGWGLKSAGA